MHHFLLRDTEVHLHSILSGRGGYMYGTMACKFKVDMKVDPFVISQQMFPGSRVTLVDTRDGGEIEAEFVSVTLGDNFYSTVLRGECVIIILN